MGADLAGLSVSLRGDRHHDGPADISKEQDEDIVYYRGIAAMVHSGVVYGLPL